MDSHENRPQLRPNRRPYFATTFLLSVLIAILAIFFFASNNSNYNHYYYFYKIRFQSRLRLLSQNGIPRFLWSSTPNANTNKNQQVAQKPPKPPYCLLWMAPFLSSGGYSSEAWSYITALHDSNPMNVTHNNNDYQPSPFRLGIEHHGDLESIEFWEGLPEHFRKLAIKLHQYPTYCRPSETIVVCHSEPGAWNPPLFQTNPCPPSARYNDFLAVIGRTMFETDRVNAEHVRRCNLMDFVWVPTDFHVSSFVNSGVDESKVMKLVQSVDVTFFDPLKFRPFDLPSLGKLVLGSSNRRNLTLNSEKDGDSSAEFVFLSIFKWEYRKGWDVLLKAYLKEFSQLDGVSLYLLTCAYHTDEDFDNKIIEFVENDPSIQKPLVGWAPVYVIDTHIDQVDMPRLYKSANAFVLPSRGEGWGRPLVEAMAMSLPVITSNFSGPTEYLTEDNSYPLIVDKLSVVKEGPFEGHLWAEPSVDGLRVLMRHVMSNVEEGKGKGRQAREDMIRKFSPQIVAETLWNYVHTVLSKRT